MRFRGRVIGALLALLLSACMGSGRANAQNIIMAEFVGSSPCDALPREFLEVPTNASCERITWQLTLRTNRNVRAPATFSLVATYGMTETNGLGFFQGGTKTEVAGQWTINHGTKANAAASVYQLNAEATRRSLSLVKIDDNLLHLLTEDKALMIGNAGWSYTLNRKRPDY